MTTVDELVVRARPEGIDETTDQLDGMQQEFDETAEEMGETTEELEGLQERWQGAMGALVAGLAVAAGGLLSQVPIVNQVGNALANTLAIIGLQLDQLLRDLGAGGFLDFITNINSGLANATGLAGDLVGIIGTLAVVVPPAVLALAKFTTVLEGLSLSIPSVTAVLSGLASTITAFVAGSLAAQGVLIALAAGFALVGLEISGFLDAVRNVADWLGKRIPQSVFDTVAVLLSPFIGALAVVGAAIAGFVQGSLRGGLSEGFKQAREDGQRVIDILRGAFTRTLERIEGLGSDITLGISEGIRTFITFVENAAEDVADAITDPIDSLNPVDWGEELVEEFAEGIEDAADVAADAAKTVAQKVDEHMPSSPAETGPLSDLDESGPGLVNTFADGINNNITTVGQASENMAAAADTSFSARRAQKPVIEMDGRRLTDQDGRYRRDETSRRGRNG